MLKIVSSAFRNNLSLPPLPLLRFRVHSYKRLLALALWLDMGKLDVLSHLYPPSANACNTSGVCSWTVRGAPMYNR